MKSCNKCGQSTPENEFYKQKQGRDGLHSSCKVCCATYYWEHSEERKTYARAHRATHPEESRAIDKAYRESHTEECTGRTRAWGKVYPEQRKVHYKAYREAHLEECRARVGAYGKAHSEECRARGHTRRARKVAAPGRFSAQEWLDLKVQYSFTCLRCGCKEPEIFLTQDHVIPLARGGSNGIENIQPLCVSCNCSKGTKTVDYRVTVRSLFSLALDPVAVPIRMQVE